MRNSFRMRSMLLLDQKKPRQKKHEELRWTTNCTEEPANPSMDLRCRKGKTYRGRSIAKGRRRSLDGFRLMQRPKSTETKVRCGGGGARVTVGARGRRWETKSERRPSQVYLWGKTVKWARKTRRPKNWHERRLDIWMVIKTKIRWDVLDKACIYDRWCHGRLPPIWRMTSWRVTWIFLNKKRRNFS